LGSREAAPQRSAHAGLSGLDRQQVAVVGKVARRRDSPAKSRRFPASR
jgi:hypothetical protein